MSSVLSVYSLWFQILLSGNEHMNQSGLYCYINLTGHKNVLRRHFSQLWWQRFELNKYNLACSLNSRLPSATQNKMPTSNIAFISNLQEKAPLVLRKEDMDVFIIDNLDKRSVSIPAKFDLPLRWSTMTNEDSYTKEKVKKYLGCLCSKFSATWQKSVLPKGVKSDPKPTLVLQEGTSYEFKGPLPWRQQPDNCSLMQRWT